MYALLLSPLYMMIGGMYIYIYILKGEVSKSNQTTECRMLIFIEK